MSHQTFPVETIARLFDLTPRRVQQLASEGVIPRAAKGRYELLPSVRGYVAFLRSRIEGEGGDYGAQRARLTRAKADMAEREAAQMAEELIPADDIEAAWTAVTASMRARLLGIPAKVAPQLVATKNFVEVQAIVRDAIYEALAELATVVIEVVSPIRASDVGDDLEEDAAEGLT